MSDVPKVQQADLPWGTSGEVAEGIRRGLPSHIDGVPVARCVSILIGGRHGSLGRALPMLELREDDDQPNRQARWPDPFGSADLDDMPW